MGVSIIAGLISGALVSFFLFIFSNIWKKQITPWIENLLYRDAQIEGTWMGILIPYVGLDELDKIREKAAWQMFNEIVKNRKEQKTTKAENAIPQYDSNGKLIAELILPEEKINDNKEDTEKPNTRRKISVSIAIKPEPIEIKVELHRAGHKITGRVIEVGGASNICSYSLKGEFRNLILACVYDTETKEDIDRGSCALMLKNNGKRLEGFFSSYSDTEHNISPVRCLLKKQTHLNDCREE
jgi:hypothetical protein